jgi:hypothetical protein
VAIQYSDNTIKFVAISLLGCRELFGMKDVEPITEILVQAQVTPYVAKNMNFSIYTNHAACPKYGPWPEA